MADTQSHENEKSHFNIRQSLMRTFFPSVNAITSHAPGLRKLAWHIYALMTPNPLRWINVHNTPLLANIHDKGIGTLLFLNRQQYALGRVAEIKRTVKERDVVVDIGANIGYFTTLLANIVGPQGKVYAFEPDPRNFLLLQRTIERNKYTQVIAEQKAVSNRPGELTLYQTAGSAANTLHPSEHVSTVNVQVITLNEYLRDEPHIDFVKMDMDGSEPLAIQGMSEVIERSPRIRILTEYLPGNLKRYLADPLEFITIAEKSGVQLANILDSDTGSLPNLDLHHLQQLEDDSNLDLLFTT